MFALLGCAWAGGMDGSLRAQASPEARVGVGRPESPAPAPAKQRQLGFVPQEVLVQFQTGTAPGGRAAVRALVEGRLTEEIRTRVMEAEGQGILERLTLPPGRTVEQAIQVLSGRPGVVFAEPNWIHHPVAVSNDPYYTGGQLWGMYGNDATQPAGPSGTSNEYGIHAEQAWLSGFTGSSTVVVGVIDEGIQVTHPDLAGNIWVNPFDPVDGVDNDGNGYVDDVHGWDFVYNDNSVYDSGEDSHGTHVAGTIGGRGGNGIGVAGVNWSVTMISAKFLGPSGGTTANAVKAVDYLTDLKRRHGLRLVASNNSWGGGGYSASLHSAIIRAAKADILFVAAAGNSSSNNDAGAYYPSNYDTRIATSAESAATFDGVVAVASLTSGGALSSFSSYGATTVDLGAPGSGIVSTVPASTYASYNGTSMATPHVTGAAALLAAAVPGAGAEYLRSVLLASATPTASLAGKTATGGRLNIWAALQNSILLTLDRPAYGLPAGVTISLNHPGANQDANAVETQAVEVSSATEGLPEAVVLTETGPATGRFVGTVELVAGVPVTDGRVQAANGDLLTVRSSSAGVTATAVVDAQPPLIANVSVQSSALVADVRWNTDEPGTSVVRYGTTPGNLAGVRTSSDRLTDHAVSVPGLQPETTYYFVVESEDAAGNWASSGMGSWTTPALASILLVDDDQGAGYESFFQSALQANQYGFDTWNVAARGASPGLAELQAYPLVIWNTGYDYSSPGAGLTATEQAALTGYLQAGGRLFLSGQDILYNGVSASFLADYLQLSGYANDSIQANHVAAGVAGDSVTDGLSLSLSKPSDYPALYIDVVQPLPSASGILVPGLTGLPHPYSASSSWGSGTGGIFGVVFLAFPFEALSTSAPAPNNQVSFMRRVVEHLRAGPAPGIIVSAPSPSSTTTEAGGTVTFTARLATPPSGNVTVSVGTSDPSEGTMSVSSLVFTPVNWKVPQSVIVTGQNDWIDDGPQTYTILLGAAVSTDPAYAGWDPADVVLVNSDDDTAGILVGTVSPASTTESGGAATFTVRLASQPLFPVTFPVASSDPTEGVVNRSSLTFTSADWQSPQTVTVTGVDDFVDDGNISYSVVLGPASSSDPLYAGLDPADPALGNMDDDTAGIVVSAPSPASTSEAGGVSTFAVRLASQPLATVTVPVASGDPTEGWASPASLAFSAGNWQVAQTVTVTGVNDWLVDGTQAYQVVLGPVASADPLYDGRNVPAVALGNLDDDAAWTVEHGPDSGILVGTYVTPLPGVVGDSSALAGNGGAQQSITEGRLQLTTGKQAKYTSGVEYRWTFPGLSGASIFTLVASRTGGGEGDQFQFQYSLNGSTWVNLAQVNSGALTTYEVTGLNLSGTVLVRAIDTVRTAAASPTYETLTVDRMTFRSTVNDLRTVVTVEAGDAEAAETVDGSNRGSWVFRRSATAGPLTVRFVTSGTAVTEGATENYLPLPESITFADGQDQVALELVPVDNSVEQGARSVTLTLEAWETDAYRPGEPAAATIQIRDNDSAITRVLPRSETTVAGTVTAGSLASLAPDDNQASEVLAELVTGGKTSQRKSYLEHRWLFDLPANTPVTLEARAVRAATQDNESFRLEYSLDNGSSWSGLGTALVGTTWGDFTASIPATQGGSLWVRVVDTDQTAGKYAVDSVSVDALYLSY